jgi:hypothetical protein
LHVFPHFAGITNRKKCIGAKPQFGRTAAKWISSFCAKIKGQRLKMQVNFEENTIFLE